MHYVYIIGASFIAGIAVSAYYFASAKAFVESELRKAQLEVSALKEKLRSKL